MAFSLDHCVWIHNWDFRVDEWMLYENYSPVARGSRGFIEGRLWTRDGRLILSSAQEGLIRSSKCKHDS
uniref:Acyl_CoA_thio domain-containing protein n=1 Tax=Ascaris lumbricoides TaxID=6252 RepID=A0A0M3I1B0_ASCLU